MALTVNQLRDGALKYNQRYLKQSKFTFSGPRIQIVQNHITRDPDKGTVLFSLITKDPDPRFQNARAVQILFHGLTRDRVLGKSPLIMWKDKVRVRSQSPFYKFCFQYPNMKSGALFGPPRRFKVKGTGRPVNPENLPGLDKHLLGALRHLKAKGYIKAS